MTDKKRSAGTTGDVTPSPVSKGDEGFDPTAVLHTLLDYLPSGVTMFGPGLEMIASNTQLRTLLDFPDSLFADGLPSLPTLLHFNAVRGDYGPGDPEIIAAAAVERTRSMTAHVIERTRPNGTVLEIRGTPLPGGGFVTIYTDITERKKTEQALRDSEMTLRLITDNVPAMILYVDGDMVCRFANRHYAEFFELPVSAIVGCPLREIVGEAAFPNLEQNFRQALKGEPVTYQRKVLRKNGEERCIEVKLVPGAVQQDPRAGCYYMALDITEQKRAEEQIQHAAYHDVLTGLPNRLLFNERLGQAISQAKRDRTRFALLYVDLDKFKPVNDTFGHAAGDALLKGVAARICERVRASDTVARIGGDEFTVILREVAGHDAVLSVAREIIAALCVPFKLGERAQVATLGASIGVALYPDDALDHETLIKLADASMYRAKINGNCVRFFGD